MYLLLRIPMFDIRRSKIKIVNERREICKNGKGGTRNGNEAR